MPSPLEPVLNINVNLPHFNWGEGEVYFVSVDCEDFPVKIGHARNVPRRIAALQTSMPWTLTLLARMPGGLDCERQMKISFCTERIRGEWYNRSPELMALIAFWRARNEKTIRNAAEGIPPPWDCDGPRVAPPRAKPGGFWYPAPDTQAPA